MLKSLSVSIHIGLLSALVFLQGCGLRGKDNSEPPAPLVEFAPRLEITSLWQAYVGASVEEDYLKLIPGFQQDKIFTASPQGHIKAFDLKNGSLLWAQKLKMLITGGVGVGENLVLVASNEGEVIALSEAEGIERWRTQISSEVLAVPHINQGIVIARTVDGKLFGLDSQTGERLWVYERSVPLLSLRGTSAPIIKDEIVIAGFDNGKIVALALKTGKLLWETPIAVPRGRTELERMVDIDADPVWIDNTVYITSFQGRTVALDSYTGKIIWERDIASHIGLSALDHTLYLSDMESHVWALDRYSGASLWKQAKLQARDITLPVVIGDYLVVGDRAGYLHWIQRQNGEFVARYSFSHNHILVPPLVVNNTLIACDERGKVMALQFAPIDAK